MGFAYQIFGVFLWILLLFWFWWLFWSSFWCFKIQFLVFYMKFLVFWDPIFGILTSNFCCFKIQFLVFLYQNFGILRSNLFVGFCEGGIVEWIAVTKWKCNEDAVDADDAAHFSIVQLNQILIFFKFRV